MITTESGLKYEDTKKMKGKKISKGDLIRINYKVALKLEDLIHSNDLIDNSDNHEEPIIIAVGVGKLVRGVDEALKGMHVGDTRRIEVPQELGFGERGIPGIIPPNAKLYIELNVSTKTK